MNLIEHAKRELKLAGLFDKDSDYNGDLATAVMELVEVFSKQGHSGFSAHRVIKLFSKVAGYEILTPLTGEDDEWADVSEMMCKPKGTLFQNNRCGAVFKDEKGEAKYNDAISWRDEKGGCWHGKAEEVSSSQTIKKFPFRPKTFYIDVIDKCKEPGISEFVIKDREQLKAVSKYYNNK